TYRSHVPPLHYFSFSSLFFLLIPPPPRSTLFPYTTLFRSVFPTGSSFPNRFSTTVSPSTHTGALVSTSAVVKNVPSRTCRRGNRSEEHTSELQSHLNLVCRLLLEKKNRKYRV